MDVVGLVDWLGLVGDVRFGIDLLVVYKIEKEEWVG